MKSYRKDNISRQAQEMAAAATAKSLQSCPTLCDPTDGSPPGSSVPGILQARTLEWVAISFCNACMHASWFSCIWLWATLWTAAHQAPLSTGFSRQEYWSGLPFPSPQEMATEAEKNEWYPYQRATINPMLSILVKRYVQKMMGPESIIFTSFCIYVNWINR